MFSASFRQGITTETSGPSAGSGSGAGGGALVGASVLIGWIGRPVLDGRIAHVIAL